ncbi:hypothetical protein BKA70DRAFT_1559555 [Coprinopsis sp. MPI-PUGE-AT-0042]|nr:hypothetical protein BKA70DRAFT_1559555 [Coprinopsis sp. MPI-PUGE-AT-0042]
MVPPRGTLTNDAVAIVSTFVTDTEAHYVFARNGRPVCVIADIKNPDIYNGDLLAIEDMRERTKVFYQTQNWSSRILQMLHSLLNQIDFENDNFIHVVQSKKGLALVPRRKRWHTLFKGPVWACRIIPQELEVTRWNTDGQANGYWNGKPVDILYGYHEEKMKWLSKATTAAYHLQDLDLTYEVYGHLVDCDGGIIGLVTEATWGRPIETGDRAIVYAGIAAAQRAGCIVSCILNGMLIAGGKLRISDLIPVQYYPPNERGERFEQDAQKRHWRILDAFFLEIEEHGKPLLTNFQLRDCLPLCLQLPPSLLKGVRGRFAFVEMQGIPSDTLWSGESSLGYIPHARTDLLSERVEQMQKGREGLQVTVLHVTDGSHHWTFQTSNYRQRRIESRPSDARASRNLRALPYQRKIKRRLPSVESDRTLESESEHSFIEEVA